MKKFLLLSASAFVLLSCGYSDKSSTKPLAETSQTVERQATLQVEKKNEVDPLVGSYKCDRTKDMYVFHADGTGEFFAMGSTSSSSFTWNRFCDDVTIVYKAFGEQKLNFNLTNKTITEKSASLGTLVFRKFK